MCGIAGVVTARPDPEMSFEAVMSMGQSLRHRGPDDAGAWLADDRRVGLAHTRLSIVDLSAAGHQPMESRCGRYVVTYNGEIYNHHEIRKELIRRGTLFRGSSDTEVLVAAIANWGLERTLTQLVGMFAFAVWDRHQQSLTLVRDRLGIKPLYYRHQNGLFLFGSELKALRAWQGWTAEVNRSSLTDFLRLSVIPGEQTIYEGVHKLAPGHHVTLFQYDDRLVLARPEPFWSLEQTLEQSRGGAALDENEAIQQLETVLSQAVEQRMLADVPVGAFLSGGIDSSTIAALMQSQSSRRIKTFTIAFDDPAYDESSSAREVALELGTEHHELRFQESHLIDLIPELPYWYDEPFGDHSQLPTLCLSRFARQEVTVVLSGDGGDEMFCGYVRHHHAAHLSRLFQQRPAWARRSLGWMLTHVSPTTWDRGYGMVQGMVPRRMRVGMPGEKAHKLGNLLCAPRGRGFYDSVVGVWSGPNPVLDSKPRINADNWWHFPQTNLRAEEQLMFADACRYLPDDILTKVDRATMSVALEARVPFLDHRVVEHAWSLPQRLKYRDGQGKLPLRRLLAKLAPSALRQRPKAGFAIPLGRWLRGELREWAEGLLSPIALRQQGFFNPAIVRKLWDEFLAGRRMTHHQLWNVLMFQAWHERWMTG